MKSAASSSRRRALRLYAAAQALVVVGAGAMSAWQSYVPMALAGAAALMLTLPLVRDIAAARKARR